MDGRTGKNAAAITNFSRGGRRRRGQDPTPRKSSMMPARPQAYRMKKGRASICAPGLQGAGGEKTRIGENRLYTRDNRQNDNNLRDPRHDKVLSVKAL